MEQIKRDKLLYQLFSDSSNIAYDEDSNTISLTTQTTDTMIALYKWLNSNSILMEYKENGVVKDNFDEISNNIEVVLELNSSYLRTRTSYNFYNTANDFLAHNRIHLNIEKFFINELNIGDSDFDTNEFFQYYKAINKLQKVINNISVDVTDQISFSDTNYIVFDKRKLTISSEYFFIDIKNLKEHTNFFSLIDELYDETVKDTDKRANSLFLINALETVFVSEKKITFSNIFKNIQKIYEEYQVHHRAYINSIEPGKLKEVFEKGIQESLGKLNTLLSDVNNKMIFLPLAFIVSLGQLSNTTHIKNFTILLGMLIFCLLVHKFSSTQRELLEIIKDDILNQEKSFKSSTFKFFKELEPKIIKLSRLADTIDERFIWTIGLTWSIFIIVLITVVIYALPIENIIHTFCNTNVSK